MSIQPPLLPRAGHEIGEESVQIYREALHPNGDVIYASQHGKHAAPGPLHGQPVLAAYPPLEGLQQKRLAARRHKTTYAYDFPTVFGNALRELWTARAIAGEPCAVPKGARANPFGNPLACSARPGHAHPFCVPPCCVLATRMPWCGWGAARILHASIAPLHSSC
jgi:hypothetical protein